MTRPPPLRWLAIVNPAAGTGTTAVRCGAALRRDGLVARVETTRAPGDAGALAQAARDVDGVVAIGGDGTVHEVLQGLDRHRLLLAIIPAGHGNCLARDLGLHTYALARRALRAPAPRRVDLIDAEVRFADGRSLRAMMVVTLAAGYVADVAYVGRRRLAALGRAAYAAASVFTRPRPLRVRLQVDGRDVPTSAGTGIIVNNTAHLANFRAFPQAQFDDGRLDVMTLCAGWARQTMHNASIFAGTDWVPPAWSGQGQRLSLEFEAPEPLMFDGELLEGVVHVTLAVHPAALRCAGASS